MELFYVYAAIVIIVAAIETIHFDDIVKHHMNNNKNLSHGQACVGATQGIIIIALFPGINLFHLVMRLISLTLIKEKK